LHNSGLIFFLRLGKN